MSLAEIKRFKGAKNKHPTTLCKCDCGGERLVRTSRFKLGQVTMCAACARADGAKRGAETRRAVVRAPVGARRRLLRVRRVVGGSDV